MSEPREWFLCEDHSYDVGDFSLEEIRDDWGDTLIAHVIEKSAYDKLAQERDAYAKAMAVALREGVFAEKGRVVREIQQILGKASEEL